MDKGTIYYDISRDFFLNSDPSYDINFIGIDNPLLDECELYNNGYEKVITEWRKKLNIPLDDVKEFNVDVYKNTKKPKIN